MTVDSFEPKKSETSGSSAASGLHGIKKFVIAFVSSTSSLPRLPTFQRSFGSQKLSVDLSVSDGTGSDVDGCRPLYVKRFSSIALAQPSLCRLGWKPTLELEWIWKFDRKADSGELIITDEPIITYDKGSDTIGPAGVMAAG